MSQDERLNFVVVEKGEEKKEKGRKIEMREEKKSGQHLKQQLGWQNKENQQQQHSGAEKNSLASLAAASAFGDSPLLATRKTSFVLKKIIILPAWLEREKRRQTDRFAPEERMFTRHQFKEKRRKRAFVELTQARKN